MIWNRFRKPPPVLSPPPEKIEIFSRHCLFSSVSRHKKRLSGFSHALCHENFLQTVDKAKANVTYLIDVAADLKREDHFLQCDALEIREGTEAKAFLRLLDHVSSLDLHPETIVYFVEDDYLHRPGWVDVLIEGFETGADYITLYDHRDKYFAPEYEQLQSKIFVTKSCHWRTVPSTTQTFACLYRTLIRDLSLHRRYSTGVKISLDHKKFSHLGRKGATLISAVPGFSTHAEPDFASPCVDWEKFF